jgi:hypothetical protein
MSYAVLDLAKQLPQTAQLPNCATADSVLSIASLARNEIGAELTRLSGELPGLSELGTIRPDWLDRLTQVSGHGIRKLSEYCLSVLRLM